MLQFKVADNGLGARLAAAGASVPAAVERVVRSNGQDLLVATKDAASHAPGPEVITGHYVSTIQMDVQGSGTNTQANVWTDAPFGARLEYGYSGTDSSGRYAFSNPHPHFSLAYQAIEPKFISDMENIVVL